MIIFNCNACVNRENAKKSEWWGWRPSLWHGLAQGGLGGDSAPGSKPKARKFESMMSFTLIYVAHLEKTLHNLIIVN